MLLNDSPPTNTAIFWKVASLLIVIFSKLGVVPDPKTSDPCSRNEGTQRERRWLSDTAWCLCTVNPASDCDMECFFPAVHLLAVPTKRYTMSMHDYWRNQHTSGCYAGIIPWHGCAHCRCAPIDNSLLWRVLHSGSIPPCDRVWSLFFCKLKLHMDPTIPILWKVMLQGPYGAYTSTFQEMYA